MEDKRKKPALTTRNGRRRNRFLVVRTAVLVHLNYHLVDIAIQKRPGLPILDIIGATPRVIKQVHSRAKSIFAALGWRFPFGTITVQFNAGLCPLELLLEQGLSQFELALFTGLAQLSGEVNIPRLDKVFIAGKVNLDGSVVAPDYQKQVIEFAVAKHFSQYIIPPPSRELKKKLKETMVFAVNSLEDLESGLPEWQTNKGESLPTKIISLVGQSRKTPKPNSSEDFADVKGQPAAQTALAIAAAGRHNALLFGPPGTGKSMMAYRYPQILPKPGEDEQIEIDQIKAGGASYTGHMGQIAEYLRPFRAPHHTASVYALTGGTKALNFGEFTLAHNGILFLDELAHFPVQALTALREVLGRRRIELSRAGGHVNLPANFWFLGAMNLCPCGLYAHPLFSCRCSKRMRDAFLRRLEGPVLDRIDIQIPVFSINKRATPGKSSAELLADTEAAAERQRLRYSNTDFNFNGEVPDGLLNQYCGLEQSVREEFETKIIDVFGYSARELVSMQKVARTIADLNDRDVVRYEDLEQAAGYKNFRRDFALFSATVNPDAS